MGILEAKTALRLNNLMVFVKFGIILLFVLVGILCETNELATIYSLWFSGVFSGAALVFFAFLGFDAVSMAAEEVKNPKKIFQKGLLVPLLFQHCYILLLR